VPHEAACYVPRRTRAPCEAAHSARCARAVLNPLRSEDEAFRFLLYAIAVILAIVALVVLLRAVL